MFSSRLLSIEIKLLSPLVIGSSGEWLNAFAKYVWYGMQDSFWDIWLMVMIKASPWQTIIYRWQLKVTTSAALQKEDNHFGDLQI